jgi:hypothetical protein
MKLLPTITTEDGWVIGSMALTLSGVILGARLAEPRAFGVTAVIVIGLLFIARSVTHSPRLSWLLVFGLGACSLLPFACVYGLLRFPTSFLTLLYAYRLVVDRRPVWLSWPTPCRLLASLVCCWGTDSPRDDSAALVRGVRAISPSLVLPATWGDAFSHTALDHFHL